MSFKEGDKVVCIGTSPILGIEEGRIYTIKKIVGENLIQIEENMYEVYSGRFREATAMDIALEGL